MHTVIRSGEIQPNEWGTIKFEGGPYGSGASLLLVAAHPADAVWFVIDLLEFRDRFIE